MLQVQKIDTFSGHRDCVYALQPSTESKHFFSAGGDGLVVKWDLTRPDWGEVIAQIPASIYSLAYDSAKGYLWLGQNYEGIQVIDPQNKQIVHSAQLTSAALFDIQLFENQAYVALSDGVVLVIERNQFAVRKHLKASTQSARCIAVNPQRTGAAIYPCVSPKLGVFAAIFTQWRVFAFGKPRCAFENLACIRQISFRQRYSSAFVCD